jgi:TNF receptor-associated factor 2
MCARIYLNGDGSGRNTHLSLFFVILRGEYDALLTWPFRQKVTFTLLDQSESNEHVVDAFRPDPNSSSFKKPISEMNIASGLPVFCPLGKLMSNYREYIRDNIMFIKIKVDCEGLDGITPTTMNTASLRRAAVS